MFLHNFQRHHGFHKISKPCLFLLNIWVIFSVGAVSVSYVRLRYYITANVKNYLQGDLQSIWFKVIVSIFGFQRHPLRSFSASLYLIIDLADSSKSFWLWEHRSTRLLGKYFSKSGPNTYRLKSISYLLM